MAGNGNGRVTMAVLSTKLDTVIANQEEEKRRRQADHDRIEALEKDVAVVKDRQGLWATAITVFNGLVAFVITRVAK